MSLVASLLRAPFRGAEQRFDIRHILRYGCYRSVIKRQIMPRKRATTSPITAGSPSDAPVRLLTLDRLDKRTLAAKRAHALVDAMVTDLGGDPSTSQMILIRQLAMATALVEHLQATWLTGGEICVAECTTLANSISRIAGQLGLARVAKDVSPSIRDIVASIAAEKAAQVAPSVAATTHSEASAPVVRDLHASPVAPPPPLAPETGRVDRAPPIAPPPVPQ
jgi:hypothetical protein